jgi:hypothetical protein
MRISRNTVLNVLTGAIALAAAASFVNDRVRPALAERARLDPGDRIDNPVLLRRIVRDDTLRLNGESPTVLLVFQSTCDVCERESAAWRTLSQSLGIRPLAMGLEADSTSVAWLRERVPTAEPVTALDHSKFLDQFRIRAVPTTLLLAEGRMQLMRIGPLQSDDLIRIDQVFAEARIGSAAKSHNR